MKKKFGGILLSIAMLFGMLPQAAMAEESSAYDQELAQYLTEISAERGFTVTKEDLEASAAAYGVTLEDFGTVDQMRNSFGAVIKADLSNLSEVYSAYGLDEASLKQLLSDNGEELDDYIFMTNLDYAVYFYTDGAVVQEPDFEQNLTHYLTGVSDQRGFIVTREDLVALLSDYGTALEDFADVGELSEYMGEVIRWEYSNLSKIYEDYDLDEASLLSLLEENGKSMDDYIYLFDLNYDVNSFSEESGAPIFDEETVADMLNMLDITDTELAKLTDYMNSYEDYFTDPVFLQNLLAIMDRLSAYDDVATLTQAQKEEFVSILDDYYKLLKLTLVVSFTKDGEEVQMSVTDLAKLTDEEIAEYTETGIKVSVYGENSQLLFDFIADQNFMDFMDGIVNDTTDDIEEAIEEQNNQPSKPVKQESSASQTEKGGKLPKTAANYIPNAVIGLFVVLSGIFLYKKVRNVKEEASR
jgi:processed acidic surface protein